MFNKFFNKYCYGVKPTKLEVALVVGGFVLMVYGISSLVLLIKL